MSDKLLTLRILTPEGTAYDGPAEAVFLPSSSGPFEVLPMHAPVICSLEKGSIVWRSGGAESSVAVLGGATQVSDNQVTVCAQPV